MRRMTEPLASLDPVRWSVYADWLCDRGRSPREVTRARRIARALARCSRPRLVLVVQPNASGLGVGFCLSRGYSWPDLAWLRRPEWSLRWRGPAWFWHRWRYADPGWAARRWSRCAATPRGFPGLVPLCPTLARLWFRRVARLAGSEEP